MLEDSDGHARESEPARVGPREVMQVLRMPIVWLIALVILCGYCAYWGTFRFTPYATDMFGLTDELGELRAIAQLPSITPAVPVTFTLAFKRG